MVFLMSQSLTDQAERFPVRNKVFGFLGEQFRDVETNGFFDVTKSYRSSSTVPSAKQGFRFLG